MVRNFVFIVILFYLNYFVLNGQERSYKFRKVVEVPVTSVKDQYKSGTCWSFAGIALLEAEILREKNEQFDLSEMWIVRHTYFEKAIRYVRFHGHTNFGPGGSFHDVTNMIAKYGIVPEDMYPGLQYGTDKHMHAELDEVLKAYVGAVVKNLNKELTTAWIRGYENVLDAYFSKKPETFTFKGKQFTPITFTQYLGINPENYVVLTSFTHVPFYKPFILELPDNWAHEMVYNVPLNELEEIIDYALNNGYTVGWASDVSEKGFSWRNGIAIIPEIKLEDLSGTERERWEALTPAERENELYKFEKPLPEKKITPELRQLAFDNYTTTDDHGMLIVGIYRDQNDNKFYKVKNSWNVTNPYEGYLFASSAYVLYKTTNIIVNKNAIPKHIRKKLNL